MVSLIDSLKPIQIDASRFINETSLIITLYSIHLIHGMYSKRLSVCKLHLDYDLYKATIPQNSPSCSNIFIKQNWMCIAISG